MIILGEAFLTTPQRNILIGLSKLFKKASWDGFNALLPGSSSFHILEFGLETEFQRKFFKCNDVTQVSAYNTYNLDFLVTKRQNFFSTHGSDYAKKFELLFPLLLPTEKDSVFINNEGRPQFSKFVLDGPEASRSDKSLFHSLQLFSFLKPKKLLSNTTLLQNLVVNLPKYENFIEYQVNKFIGYVQNTILSSESISIFENDYLSRNSRNLLGASETLLATRMVNFKF